MPGGVYSSGGIDINNGYVGPILNKVRAPYGPNGANMGGNPIPSRGGSGVQATGTGDAQAAGMAGIGSPVVVLTGLLGLGALLWVLRKNSSYLQQNAIGFNLFNTLTIAIVAIVGILMLKITFNKLPVPGITPVVNAI